MNCDNSRYDAKAFLQQVENCDTHIADMLEEIDILNALAVKVNSAINPNRVSGGNSSHDKVGDTVAKIVDLQSEIDRAVDEYIAKKKEVCSVLNKVSDAKQRRVLHLHYVGVQDERTQKVHYLKWKEIAEEMGYAERHITRLHGWGLRAVKEILKEGNNEC